MIYKLDYGGLENGLVNILNRLPRERYQHTVVTLAGFSDYSTRLPPEIKVENVEKKPGLDFGVYIRLWRLFRSLRPDVVHSRNLSTLESQLPAMLAGVSRRVHGEHGRDMHDLDNTRIRYRMLRRIFSFIVQRYISVSRELQNYLVAEVGVSPARVTRICNGVDISKFQPAKTTDRTKHDGLPADVESRIVIGTVGRMQAVKDQLTLVRAFIELVSRQPRGKQRLALVIVGDGPLRETARSLLIDANMLDIAWLPGARDDTPQLLRILDVFVLPSLAEGISNTILEAMATGLPVVATDVGGNAELVEEGVTGYLVPRADPTALANAIATYVDTPSLRTAHGLAAREKICREFSLDGMVARYATVYDELMA